MNEDDRLLAIQRTPEGLVTVLSRQRNDFWQALYNDNLVDLLEMYEIVEEPLELFKKACPGIGQKWFASWKFLVKVRKWDGKLLTHVLSTLINTSPVYPEKNLHLPVLDLDTEQPAPRKTAANPRGLHKTKGKKQKPKSPPEMDLRPYLCDPKNVSVILNKLKPFWTEAVQNLCKENPTRFYASRPPAFSLNPYMIFRHPGSGNIKHTGLPRNFAQYFLFWLTDLPWKRVRKFLALYHELQLEQDPSLMAAAARLMASCDPSQSLTWLQMARDLPSGKRYSFLLTLLVREALDADFKQYPPAELVRLCAMIPYPYLEERLDNLFGNISHRISFPYIAGGFALAKRFGWDNGLALYQDYPAYPEEKVDQLLKRLKIDSFWMALSIWRGFGDYRDWESILFRPEWKDYPPKTARLLLYRFMVWVKNLDRHQFNKSRAIQFLDTLGSAMTALPPERQMDFLLNIQYFYEDTEDRDRFDTDLKPMCALLTRLAREPIPFSNLVCHGALLNLLLLTQGATRRKVIEAPDASFIKLNKTSQTENRRCLITWGLYNLSFHLPEFTATGFCDHPSKLFKLAWRLGSLKFYNRNELVRRLSHHQLLKADYSKMKPERLYRLIEAHHLPGITHPVPKKLRQHFQGDIELSDPRIQGYHEKTKNNFTAFVFEVLDREVLDAMSGLHPAVRKNENMEHTLQLLNWVKENRRGFKNFLKAYLGGDNHYVENHPLTKRWFAKHKKIDRELWNRGIMFCRRTEKHGPVRIELENDPLEILKMGTYVGSCLSLGGSYAHSAVAVLLDLNKQVLYARDQNNKVVGRQLIAISEEDELVCFEVYPLTASAKIKNLFFEYDIEFARALNIDLHEGKFSGKDSDEYTVKQILSESWYDDWPWDKIAPEI